MKTKTIAMIAALLIYAGLSTTTMATAASQGPDARKLPGTDFSRQETAPEAYSACKGKSSGESAEMIGPKGETVSGRCQATEEGSLVLRPQRNGSRAGRHNPPPEAYAACEGKSSGDRSQLMTPHGETVNGECTEDPTGQLVLRPDRQPR